MAKRFWDEAAETMPRSEIGGRQLDALRAAVGGALKTPFYRPRLEGVGIKSPADIKSLADIRKIPFTTKDDLREAFPFGMLAVDRSEVVRMHASSGTTGIPTVIYLTAKDVGRWTDFVARSLTGAGADSSDVFQNMMTYGLFTGGLGMHYGAEKVGMMVIPAGPGNTSRQLKLMKDFGTTTIHATPSYLLHLHSKMAEEGIAPGDFKLKRAFCGAEPYTEDTRRKIESLFGIEVYNSYGLSEMNGPGVAFECERRDGMHLWEDGYILEIVDRDSLESLSDGKSGEIVLTILCREAMPILRYRTRDLSSVYEGECPCGRTHRRIARIMGRTDDMLIINGINVFPSQIEEVIMAMPEAGNNYLILVDKVGALDRLTVKVEVGSGVFADDSRPLNALRDRICAKLQTSISIKARVELHEPGILPVSEGKAKRVIDERSKL
jgi:Coenzyme F390 synthetase